MTLSKARAKTTFGDESRWEELLSGLRDLHHPCARATELRSGSTAIAVGSGGLTGAADARRDGIAVGD